MPKLRIENLYDTLLETSQPGQTVLSLIHGAGIDWMHACGKKGRCTSCKMIVTSGLQNLSPLSPREEFFRQQGRLSEKERLTCQAQLMEGEVVCRVAEVNKFPHMDYSF
ncbi:MAG: 2Fe-2S iron-sulfur cluster binding domain-containing protein [Nitritalea sp.]